METDNIVEWMRRRGHKIYRTESSYWYDAGPRVLQAFPYNWIIRPTQRELNSLMVKHGIISLRYSTPLDAPEGMASYHVILNGDYSLEKLDHRARNGVKKGNSSSTVEQIPFERLATEGWKLQYDTLTRQGRTDSMTQEEWECICLAAKNLPGFEAWAAIVNGELASSLLVANAGDIAFLPFACSQTKFINKHVNNAIFYDVCTNLMGRGCIDEIFIGLHSLDAPASVDEFKFRMSFIPRPVRQRVVFNPLLMPFANNVSHQTLKKLLDRKPGSHILSKAEGMLRFHLQGKQPLTEQEWPECLDEEKAKWASLSTAVTASVESSQIMPETGMRIPLHPCQVTDEAQAKANG